MGSITGFDLPALVKALNAHGHPHLRESVTSGTSPFNTLALSANFANGEGTVTAARLTAPDGTATMSGNIDMVDRDVALRLSLQPNVKPPLQIDNTIVGSWQEAKPYPRLHATQGWKAGALRKQRKTSFCEQKVAKKLCYSGPVRLDATGPAAQKFLRRLFQKAAAFFKT